MTFVERLLVGAIRATLAGINPARCYPSLLRPRVIARAVLLEVYLADIERGGASRTGARAPS